MTDRHTGLALYGVDPVGYFTERKPIVGRAEFEYRFAGAIWRFDNEGNRAAFADPDVYMPRFGGYDPVGVARGVSTPGNPQLWAVVERPALSLLYGASARRLHRRSSLSGRGSRSALGRGDARPRRNSVTPRAAAPPRSPQAMKPGMRKSSRERP